MGADYPPERTASCIHTHVQKRERLWNLREDVGVWDTAYAVDTQDKPLPADGVTHGRRAAHRHPSLMFGTGAFSPMQPTQTQTMW